ncbi:MAG: hypothetical protein JNK23_05780 [Opitutaceae bacterium]|nr:hypothetical protein [Opitutaceae bacterium]
MRLNSTALPLLVVLAAFTPRAANAQSFTWTNAAPSGLSAWSENMQAVTYGNGRFVAAGSVTGIFTSHRIAFSTDLVTWTDAVTPTVAGNGLLRTAAYGNGLYAVGVFGTPVSNTQKLYTSTDGVNWTLRDVRLGTVWGIDYVNGLWIAVGDSGNSTSSLATSPDGITWTARATGSADDLNATAYGAGLFVAVGNNSQVVTSPDGLTWTRRTLTDSGVTVTDVVFAAGKFVASTLSGAVYTSPDGLAWTRQPVPGSTRLNTITHGGGRFVVGGDSFLGTSTDGITWATDTTNVRTIRQLVLGGGVFVAGADIGAVYRSGLPTIAGPTITAQPQPASAVAGGSATFSVTATGAISYQWKRNGTPIPGATSASLVLTGANVIAGSYSVDLTNAEGTVTSTSVTLTIVSANAIGRLINLSVLTGLDSATDDLSLGYVVGGAGTSGAKPLVIRAAGPSLGAFGVPGTISDPRMELFAGATRTGENDNWGGSADLAAALAAVGAFAYVSPSSRDAAVAASITTRDNSVRVTGVGGVTGQVIAEVYDATPSSAFTSSTPRLLNVSVRKHLGTGLSAGFVIGGSTSVRVLIRVVGPGLAVFGVPGTVVDPQLELFRGSTPIDTNNDWSNSATVAAAGTSVGAFGLPANSRDAALVTTLPPGNYSVRATGVNNTTGVALVEVYELP